MPICRPLLFPKHIPSCILTCTLLKIFSPCLIFFFFCSKDLQLAISQIPSLFVPEPSSPSAPALPSWQWLLQSMFCLLHILLCGSANSSLALVKIRSKWHCLHWIGIKRSTDLHTFDVHLEALTYTGHARIILDKDSFCRITFALAVDITSIWV